MAVSRTLEPDPGHTGVGTENARKVPLSLLRFTWISVKSFGRSTMTLADHPAADRPLHLPQDGRAAGV
jgi:hypothetical protein